MSNRSSRGGPLFQGFFQGGFEASTLRWWDGRQIDVIGATRHDEMASEDYRLMRRAGLHTARDGLRWHLIRAQPRLLRLVQLPADAARRAG